MVGAMSNASRMHSSRIPDIYFIAADQLTNAWTERQLDAAPNKKEG